MVLVLGAKMRRLRCPGAVEAVIRQQVFQILPRDLYI